MRNRKLLCSVVFSSSALVALPCWSQTDFPKWLTQLQTEIAGYTDRLASIKDAISKREEQLWTPDEAAQAARLRAVIHRECGTETAANLQQQTSEAKQALVACLLAADTPERQAVGNTAGAYVNVNADVDAVVAAESARCQQVNEGRGGDRGLTVNGHSISRRQFIDNCSTALPKYTECAQQFHAVVGEATQRLAQTDQCRQDIENAKQQWEQLNQPVLVRCRADSQCAKLISDWGVVDNQRLAAGSTFLAAGIICDEQHSLAAAEHDIAVERSNPGGVVDKETLHNAGTTVQFLRGDLPKQLAAFPGETKRAWSQQYCSFPAALEHNNGHCCYQPLHSDIP
jgi:cell division protein FtsB